MSIHKSSRRDFIKRSAVGTIGSTIGWNATSYASIIGFIDWIGIGLAGSPNAHRMRYEGTVSNITDTILRPAAYSQM